MKKVTILLFTFILIGNVIGNAAEVVPVDMVLSDNSLSVGKIYNIRAETTSVSELEQSMGAFPEPITELILGLGLVMLGVFVRKYSRTGN
jgi:hypothetical protein